MFMRWADSSESQPRFGARCYWDISAFDAICTNTSPNRHQYSDGAMSERTLRLPMKDPVSGCQRVGLERQIWRFRLRGLRIILLSALLVALSPACRSNKSHKIRAKSNRLVSPPQQLVPLMADKAIDKLELAHFEPASIVIPLGTRWARPV